MRPRSGRLLAGGWSDFIIIIIIIIIVVVITISIITIVKATRRPRTAGRTAAVGGWLFQKIWPFQARTGTVPFFEFGC